MCISCLTFSRVIILHVIWNHSITTPSPTAKALNVHCWSSSSVPSVLLAPLPHLLHANLLLFFSILSHCVTLITFTSQACISLHLLLIHKVASPKAVSDVGINTLKILLKDTFDVQSPSCVLFCFKYFSSFLCQLKGVAILLMALVQSWSKMYRLIYLHWEARIFGNIFTCVAGASLCKGVQ